MIRFQNEFASRYCIWCSICAHRILVGLDLFFRFLALLFFLSMPFSPSPLLVACELETRFLDSPCVIPTELPFAGGYVKAPIATTKLTMFESYSPLKRSLSFLTIETHSRFDLHRTMPWHLNAMVIIPKQYFRWPLRLRGGVLALAVLI
jgi:hypothetical protein